MSTSADEYADRLKMLSRLAHAVAKEHPTATRGVLFRDGPEVFIVERGYITPTHVEAVNGGIDRGPEFFRYAVVKVETYVARVYERLDFPTSLYMLLDRLEKTRPELLAALVEEAGKS